MPQCNKSELARLLSCSRQAVIKHLGKPDAPKPGQDGLFDLEAVRRFISAARTRDNRNAPSGELLRAKITKLTLECDDLRRKLKTDRPSIPTEDINELLWRFLSEFHRLSMVFFVHLGPALTPDAPAYGLGAMTDALGMVEDRLCLWMDQHNLKVRGGEWPLPHPSFLHVYRKSQTAAAPGGVEAQPPDETRQT